MQSVRHEMGSEAAKLLLGPTKKDELGQERLQKQPPASDSSAEIGPRKTRRLISSAKVFHRLDL